MVHLCQRQSVDARAGGRASHAPIMTLYFNSTLTILVGCLQCWPSYLLILSMVNLRVKFYFTIPRSLSDTYDCYYIDIPNILASLKHCLWPVGSHLSMGFMNLQGLVKCGYLDLQEPQLVHWQRVIQTALTPLFTPAIIPSWRRQPKSKGVLHQWQQSSQKG